MTAASNALELAVEKFLADNNPEEFGCACEPGRLCGPCSTVRSQAPLLQALAGHRAHAQSARERLTDKQIEDGRRNWLHGPAGQHPSAFVAGVRFAERHYLTNICALCGTERTKA